MEKVLVLCLLAVSRVRLVSSACDAVTDAATYSSERASNAVEIKFYRIQTDKWNDGGSSNDVAIQVINHANTYCASNAGTCGLQTCCSSNYRNDTCHMINDHMRNSRLQGNYARRFISSFKETMVFTVEGYPKNTKKDLYFKIALDFPTDLNSVGTPQCVMPKSALQIIIANAREDIHSSTGYWITYIDDEFYGIPPPTELNQIIIPIACAILLGLVVLTIVLNIWNKRKEDAQRRMKIIEQRKTSKKALETPVYTVDSREPRTASGVTGRSAQKQKPKRQDEREKSPSRKDQLYKDNLRQSTLDANKTSSSISEDSAIKVDTDSRQRQAFSYEKQLDGDASGYNGYDQQDLPGHGGYSEPDAPLQGHLQPIEVLADDEGRSPEKKKKKKKKRSKSKEVMNERTNDGYTNTDENRAYE